jgi:hypothetical protein
MQMAGRLFWKVRPDDSVRTDGLHLEGFAHIFGMPFARQGTIRLRPMMR